MEPVIWGVACFLVVGFLVARALRNAPKNETWATVDQEFDLIFTERIVYQRPASERLGDLGGQL